MKDIYEPIDAAMRAFIEAVIAYAPVGLAPLRAQLATARMRNDSNGWISVVDVAEGSPIAWPPVPGDSLGIIPTAKLSESGPRHCSWVGLRFHEDGRLDAIEFYNDDHGPMDIAATTAWLNVIRPTAAQIAITESALAACLRDASAVSRSDA